MQHAFVCIPQHLDTDTVIQVNNTEGVRIYDPELAWFFPELQCSNFAYTLHFLYEVFQLIKICFSLIRSHRILFLTMQVFVL